MLTERKADWILVTLKMQHLILSCQRKNVLSGKVILIKNGKIYLYKTIIRDNKAIKTKRGNKE